MKGQRGLSRLEPNFYVVPRRHPVTVLQDLEHRLFRRESTRQPWRRRHRITPTVRYFVVGIDPTDEAIAEGLDRLSDFVDLLKVNTH
jgi:hypothetical protein